MAGGQHRGAEVARARQQVGELDGAGCRSTQGIGVSPAQIAFDEIVDHRFLEADLVVEHVMRNAEALGRHAPRVMDVLARRSRRPCGGWPRHGRKAAA